MLAKLAAHLEPRAIEDGVVLVRLGDVADAMYVISRGTFADRNESNGGRGGIPLRILTVGDPVGQMGAERHRARTGRTGWLRQRHVAAGAQHPVGRCGDRFYRTPVPLGTLGRGSRPGGFLGQVTTLALAGVGLGAAIPDSVARTSLVAPATLEMADALGHALGSRAAAGLAMAVQVGLGQVVALFLTSSSTALLAYALLPETARSGLTWGTWTLRAAPVHVIMLLGLIAAIVFLYRPSPPTRRREVRQPGSAGAGRHAQRLALQRALLASIRGRTESLLLSGELDRDARRSYLEVIHRQSEQLSRLIDDLFLLSTTEGGALELAPRPLALGDVIDDVVSSIQPAARSDRRVTLLSEVEPSLPPVLADRQRVAQVIANLIRNAVRHTPEGGIVAVRAAQLDERLAEVTVEDTGDGIPPEELERVFERCYRADPSRDRASGGAGLGLAIVRELVVAMGGEVSAESVVGEGSRFSFTLPLVPELAAENAHPRTMCALVG